MAETNTSNIGFEKQMGRGLCAAAIVQSIKSILLGLIFLKYISDRFETKYQELVRGDSFEEDKDKYTAKYFLLCGRTPFGA